MSTTSNPTARTTDRIEPTHGFGFSASCHSFVSSAGSVVRPLRIAVTLVALALAARAGAEEKPDDHAGHDHASHTPERDPTPAEIEATQCEHKVPIAQCAECRYEAGVAALDPAVGTNLVGEAVATPGAIPERREFTGEIREDPTRIAPLLVPAAGRIVHAARIQGDRVRAGDVILTVRSPACAEAAAAWLEASARRVAADRKLARERELRAKEIGAAADLEDAELAAGAAVAAMEAARGRLALFGVAPDDPAARTAAAAGQFDVRAPRDGVLTDLAASPGLFVGDQAAVGRVCDHTELWAIAHLQAGDIAPIDEALREHGPLAAGVRVAGLGDRAFPGRLDWTGGDMIEATRTVEARVRLDAAGGVLRPGMFARITVEMPTHGETPLVPAEAVLEDGGRTFVFEKWTAPYWLRRHVVTGRSGGGQVEILEGLTNGATVAARGSFVLKSDVLREKMGAGCAD